MRLSCLLIVIFFVSCNVSTQQEKGDISNLCDKKYSRNVEEIKAVYEDPRNKNVFVIAHRGDWRHAPENSLQAIQNCIDMGVDAVEIDVRKTADGEFVLMHDETIDRTTTGSGNVEDWTLDSLKTLFLKNGTSYVTNDKIPTLEEALLLCRGRIMVDLDMKGATIPEVYPILKRTNTVDHCFNGSYDTYNNVKERYGAYLDSIHFVPSLRDKSDNIAAYIAAYEQEIDPSVYAVKFTKESSHILPYIDSLTSLGNRVWMHTISASRSAGHHDDRAVYDPEGSYGWLIEKGVGMIQTDRPKLLLDYLRKEGLHD